MFHLDPQQGAQTVVPGKDTEFHHMVEGDHNYLKSPGTQSAPLIVAPKDLPPLHISDDGRLAVEANADTPKVMFMDAGQIDPTNEKLEKAGSSFRLVNKGKTLSVPALDNSRHALVSVMPANITNKTSELATTGPQQCIEMAESVISAKKGDAYREYLLDVASGNLPAVNREAIGKTMVAFIGQYAMAKRTGGKRSDHEQIAKQAGVTANAPPTVPRDQIDAVIIEVTLKDKKPETANGMSKAIAQYNTGRTTALENARADKTKMAITIYDPVLQGKKYYGMNEPPFSDFVARTFFKRNVKVKKSYEGKVSEPYETWKPKLATAVAAKEDSLIDTINNLTGSELETALSELGLNEHAKLGIGQAFGVTAATKSTTPKMRFPYHWAGVIAKSGQDVATMENYARGEGATVDDDGRWYLQLYGPLRKVDVSKTGDVAEDRSVDPNYWKAGTFHGRWKGEFGGGGAVPITVGVGTKESE